MKVLILLVGLFASGIASAKTEQICRNNLNHFLKELKMGSFHKPAKGFYKLANPDGGYLFHDKSLTSVLTRKVIYQAKGDNHSIVVVKNMSSEPYSTTEYSLNRDCSVKNIEIRLKRSTEKVTARSEDCLALVEKQKKQDTFLDSYIIPVGKIKKKHAKRVYNVCNTLLRRGMLDRIGSSSRSRRAGSGNR